MNSPDFCYLLSGAASCGNRGQGGALHPHLTLSASATDGHIWHGSEPNSSHPEPTAVSRYIRDPSHKWDHLGHIALLLSIPRQAEGRVAWRRNKGCRLGTMARAPLWPDPPCVLPALQRLTYTHHDTLEIFLPSVFQRGALLSAGLGAILDTCLPLPVPVSTSWARCVLVA